MTNLNTVVLMGNLTRDPEVRSTASGTSVASFGLAVNTAFGAGEKAQSETLFIDITAFGAQADPIGRYLTKGRPVLVEGRLRLESWTGNDGQKRSKISVVANRVEFLSDPDRATSPTASRPSPARRPASERFAGEEDEDGPPPF